MRVSSRKEAKQLGLSRYFTGEPCPKGHVSDRRTSNGECVECALIYRRTQHHLQQATDPAYRQAAVARANKSYTRRRAPIEEEKAKRRSGQVARARTFRPDLEIRSRKEALALGVSHYFTGAPCSRGHIDARDVEHRACVQCRTQDLVAWKKRNTERVSAYNAEYLSKNLDRCRAIRDRRRARKLAAGGNYTAEDIAFRRKEQRDRCAYCGVKLRGKGHIDHIVPLAARKGKATGTNAPSNLQLLCGPCNLAKSNKDPLDFARELGLLL